jgi:hypothetical protein
MQPEIFDHVTPHAENLQRHVNDQVRKGSSPSLEKYVSFLHDEHEKSVSNLKTQKGKTLRSNRHTANIAHVLANAEAISRVMELHSHLQSAKNSLAKVMARSDPWKHSIDGAPSTHEGVVATSPAGKSIKYVNRNEFSRHNFLSGAFKK